MLARFNDRRGFPAFGAPRAFPEAFLRQELGRLFAELERAPSFGAAQEPALAFEDTGEAFRLRAELPGLTEKDIEISVTAKALTLKASRQATTPEGYTAHRRERQSFKFTRSYELPARVDPDKVEATLKQGVLTLTLPKVAESQPKKVSVTAQA